MNVNIGFDIMSIIIILTVIGFFFFYKQLRQRDGKSFLLICCFSLVTLILDLSIWLMIGVEGEIVHTIEIVFTQFYYAIFCGNIFFFIFYILSKCRMEKYLNKILLYGSVSLYIIFVFILFAMFPNGLIFKFTENNYYNRGELFWVVYLFYFIFSFINLISTILNLDDIKGREFLSFLFLTIVSVISLIVQLVVYPFFANTCSCGIMAIGIFLVFVNNQEFAIQDAGLDAMTNLKNRTTYLNMLDTQFKGLKSCAIVFFDINNLKYINDTYGHAAGDHVIINVSNSLSRLENDRIFSFRIGGDEFVTVYTNCTNIEVEEYVRAWKIEIADIMKNDVYKSEVSFGFSFGEGVFSIDFLAHEADINMYAQKRASKVSIEKNAREEKLYIDKSVEEIKK